MYQNFFGLTAEPFSIAPDPHFLFLSDRHQEALAHLSFGLQGSGGFILLTGEVGTGKTTVSRALLEQLTEQTRTAFILNPMLNEQELLATLCDEFGIRYAKRNATVKTLTDKLSQFLLSVFEAGGQCLVLIDEAQHLQPNVLEQLRLLTNLETNQQKLLRVILIGQPELQDLLRRRELRQLAQRITARYHLLPLTAEDTARYIAFRLQVAGARAAIFTPAAVARVHSVSEGIPRRLNVLCDRAMLAAYNDGSAQVLPKHIRIAVAEVDGVGQPMTGSRWSLASVAAVLVGVGLLAGVAAAVVYQLMMPDAEMRESALTSTPTESALTQPPPATSAVQDLVKQWQLPRMSAEQSLCDWVTTYDLSCLRGQMRFDQLQAINYPALLVRENGDYALLADADSSSPPADWTGEFILFWQPPDGYFADSADRYESWLQRAVEQAMREVDRPVRANSTNEAEVYRLLQSQAGLPVTGELDGATLAWLSAKVQRGGPRLTSTVRGGND